MATDDVPPSGEERLSISGTAGIAEARAVARRTATRVLPPDRRDDVELVTSELVTNALEHGAGGRIDLVARYGPAGLELSVSSQSDWLPVRPPTAVPVTETNGRGLHIVSVLSDHIVVEGDGGVVRVICRFEA